MIEYPIEIVGFPIKNGDFPIENGGSFHRFLVESPVPHLPLQIDPRGVQLAAVRRPRNGQDWKSRGGRPKTLGMLEEFEEIHGIIHTYIYIYNIEYYIYYIIYIYILYIYIIYILYYIYYIIY